MLTTTTRMRCVYRVLQGASVFVSHSALAGGSEPPLGLAHCAGTRGAMLEVRFVFIIFFLSSSRGVTPRRPFRPLRTGWYRLQAKALHPSQESM